MPIILYTDSKSLYNYFVKLGTIQEKRLIVDIMCLWQSYKGQKIMKIKWINGDSNSANTITKAKPYHAFQKLINTNMIYIKTSNWVEWGTG